VTDDPLPVARTRAAHRAARTSDAAADEQSRQLHRQPRQRLPLAGEQAEALGVEIYPGFAAPKCCTTMTAR
jgi:hypothetical protein